MLRCLSLTLAKCSVSKQEGGQSDILELNGTLRHGSANIFNKKWVILIC